MLGRLARQASKGIRATSAPVDHLGRLVLLARKVFLGLQVHLGLLVLVGRVVLRVLAVPVVLPVLRARAVLLALQDLAARLVHQVLVVPPVPVDLAVLPGLLVRPEF
jgi:hypothetical protein